VTAEATDPTGPGYISDVAIFLGDGKMIPAPETGENGGARYRAVGMLQLVDAVRGTGARSVVIAEGIQYAETVDRWLSYRPSDLRTRGELDRLELESVGGLLVAGAEFRWRTDQPARDDRPVGPGPPGSGGRRVTIGDRRSGRAEPTLIAPPRGQGGDTGYQRPAGSRTVSCRAPYGAGEGMV
jgi:hypothetical protein